MDIEAFAKEIRTVGAKFRVDKVVVSAGKAQFRGAGILIVEDRRLAIELTLSARSLAPERNKDVWNAEDFWKLKGVLEHSLNFSATHVSPGTRRFSSDLKTIKLRFQILKILPKRPTPRSRRALEEQIAKLRNEMGFALPAIVQKPNKNKRIAQARIIATFLNTKLIAQNVTTFTFRRNSFIGKTKNWKLDTFFAKGSRFDLALVKDETNLQLHFRSTPRYISKNSKDDLKLFRAVLNAIGFTHGFNAWPHRLQQWRDGREEMNEFTAPERRPQTSHAPFDDSLSISGSPPPLQLVTRFFASHPLSETISEYLFTFRQAGDKPVHFPITTLALCSLFEGLIRLLFRELRLEDRMSKKRPELKKFLIERDKLVKELQAKGKLGDASSLRLAGLVGHAEAIRLKDMFEALCDKFRLDRSHMKSHFTAWSTERNLLMHGTWKDHEDDDFARQARIAGAINILLLKLMGYKGKVVAVRFGDNRETYRTI